MLINRRTSSILFLGFFSGLPLVLSGSTLQAWFTTAGVSIAGIGALTLVSFPYVLKFLWAPLMDRYSVRWFGRRRGWIAVTQILIALTLMSMAFCNPIQYGYLLAVFACLLAFFSASQDIAINAYQTEILVEEERGVGASAYVVGYRLAILVSGGLALIFADFIGWKLTYIIMALVMLSGVFFTRVSPKNTSHQDSPKTIKAAIVDPFRDFLSRKSAIIILLFIILYKFGDAFGLSLNTAFLLRGVGFSLIDIGTVYKITSVVATLAGTFVGGVLMSRLSLYRSLFIFGVLQSLSLLLFVWLALVGKNFTLMASAIGAEFFTGGMATAAFFALLMSLCNKRYTATQFALFSAIASVGRVMIGPIAAVVVSNLGWAFFYMVAALLAIPGLFLLYLLNVRGHFR